MEITANFFSEFLNAEAIAQNAARMRNIDDFNIKLDQMNRFLSPELQNGLGMLPKTKPEDDDYYKIYEGAAPLRPRYLFRIDQYVHPSLGKIYGGIVATIGGRMKRRYGAIYWARENDGELNVFASSVWNLESKHWDQGPGFRGLDMEVLGKPVSTLRIAAPQDDEYSMQLYMQD